MKQFRISSLLLVVAFSLSCGGGNGNRQLLSISIAQTANGQQVQFVATGMFSAAPTTVSPLPVDWTLGLMAPPPPQYSYTLTTQPYVYNCANAGPSQLPVVAFAPADPNAPTSGVTKTVVSASTAIHCQ
jgi:hypothetical protein